MDDTTNFERSLAAGMDRLAGPRRPVDALAIARSAAVQSPKRGLTMFSTVKFVAAAAIVALFGGFLLAGVLTTQQGDDMTPAAATESPSPMTSEELLSGMVTEEVEPGVYRVINDGVRDLAYAGGTVDVTPDGNVWLSGPGDGQDLFRLGEERVFEGLTGEAPFRQVAPDGSLWAIGEDPDERPGIYSFDGERWTERATATDLLYALAVGPDGTVWVGAVEPDRHCPDIESDACYDSALLRLEDDGSLTTVEDWSDVHDGDAWLLGPGVSPDGDVWLVGEGGETKDGTEPAGALLRFDGEGWEAIPGPEGWAQDGLDGLASGPDGTLWMDASRDVNRGALARYDDAGWTTFTDADGVEPWHDTSGYWGFMLPPAVAADGSLWLEDFDDYRCDGAAHYDGTTWTSYLEEYCISDLAIAPDGSVWLGASAYDYDTDMVGPSSLYVITPEALEPPPVEEVIDVDEASTTAAELLPGMVTEEVEPGVHRVINDGVRDLASVEAVDVVAGYDDGIWLLREDELLRLGSDDSHEWPVVGPGSHGFEVAPDRTMWVIPCGSRPYRTQCGDVRRSTDGEEWTVEPCPEGSTDCQGSMVAPDGTVWASWEEDGQWRVGHLGPTSWQPLDGYARSEGAPYRGYQRLFVTDAGDIYGMDRYDIWRYIYRVEDDGGWEFFSGQPSFNPWAALVGVGRDGTVWLGNDEGLAMWVEGRWERWAADDLLPEGRYGISLDGEFEVAPDGGLWFSLWQSADGTDPRPGADPEFWDWEAWVADGRLLCDGLARFDGNRDDRFLSGRCVSIDIAANGSVWVLAADEAVREFDDDRGWVRADNTTWDLYVITPEAVAAAG
jgi:hypothetical protein